MTRLCYLQCDTCTVRSERRDNEIDLLNYAVEAGWSVQREEDKHVCPQCRAKPIADFWENPKPSAPAAADLTWE